MLRGRQAQLAEDAGHVLLDGAGGQDEHFPDAGRDRPCAIRDSTSRPREVSAARPARLAASIWLTTSGSSAVPPAATRASESANSAAPVPGAEGRRGPGSATRRAADLQLPVHRAYALREPGQPAPARVSAVVGHGEHEPRGPLDGLDRTRALLAWPAATSRGGQPGGCVWFWPQSRLPR